MAVYPRGMLPAALLAIAFLGPATNIAAAPAPEVPALDLPPSPPRPVPPPAPRAEERPNPGGMDPAEFARRSALAGARADRQAGAAMIAASPVVGALACLTVEIVGLTADSLGDTFGACLVLGTLGGGALLTAGAVRVSRGNNKRRRAMATVRVAPRAGPRGAGVGVLARF